MGQYHPAHAATADTDVRGLHGDIDGEREVVEVPVIRVAFAVGEAQRRVVAVAAVEQPRVVQAENAADQQPGAGNGQAGVQVVQGQVAAMQARAGRQLQGHCGEAGDGGDTDGEQHQASVFVFHAGDAADLFRVGSPGQPQHQQQVQPDAEVPAGKNTLHGIVGRDQPRTEDADQRGKAQAGVGAGQSVQCHGASATGSHGYHDSLWDNISPHVRARAL